VDAFPGQSIDFFGALRARVYDDKVSCRSYLLVLLEGVELTKKDGAGGLLALSLSCCFLTQIYSCDM
jgi:hypothetical protein